jgi:predicted unusual protein kinase regulating ubiquinone biosynthesis (AarF/ABC1/UbiB family)
MRNPFKIDQLSRYKDFARLLLKYGGKDLLSGSQLESFELEFVSPHAASPSASTSADTRAEGSEDLAAKGKQLADDLEAMGPTFIKVGQFLSSRPDLLPAPILEALSRLQDQVEPFSFEEVERIVSEELGMRLSRAFAHFDARPVAAASLGQVHRARLRSGRSVAVKVQRPGIREQVLKDLEFLQGMAEFLEDHTAVGHRYGVKEMAEEFRKSLLRELDYRLEARHLEVIGRNLSHLELIVVPAPVHDYVTTRVLTMDFVPGTKVTDLGPLDFLELQGTPLAEALCQAYLQQILVDGFFHADPHPGNVFITGDGRLALLDLGMVAQIAPHMQDQLVKLVLAMSEGHGEEAARAFLTLVRPLGEPRTEEVRSQIAEAVARFHQIGLGDVAMGRLLFDAGRVAVQGGYHISREMTMLSKTLLSLDQIARHLDPRFDPNASIRKHVSEILRKRMLHSLSPGKLFAGALDLKEIVEKLPGRLNRLLEAAAENRLQVRVKAIDEVLLMEGLQKIANRITLGLVISALIVGAALMTRVETSFRILGYPGIPLLLFLGAGASALALVWNIVLRDLQIRRAKMRTLKQDATRS